MRLKFYFYRFMRAPVFVIDLIIMLVCTIFFIPYPKKYLFEYFTDKAIIVLEDEIRVIEEETKKEKQWDSQIQP